MASPARRMKLRPSMPALAGALIALALSGSEPARAWQTWSADRDSGNCADCHGNYLDSPYTSLVDGRDWGDSLHDTHRTGMLDRDCDTCHLASGRFPVETGSSAGGDGLSPFGCVGCHGRSEDGSGQGTSGFGAGLRQHHWREGISCLPCHADSDPSSATPVGESVQPPYYANPGNNHPNMPTDACNPAPGFNENFAGTVIGLDNDGDSDYDEADVDCAMSECGNGIVEPGEDCDDGNILDGDCCSSTCQFELPGSPCDDRFCTVNQTCDGAGACGGGEPRDCDDGDICTDDSCNPAAGRCDNIFDPGNAPECEDGCIDADQDGFSILGGGCGEIDCNDQDPAINPGAGEICGDDIDNNCNGLIDAADPECEDDAGWQVRSGPLDDPAYAGSNACASCHPGKFDDWIDSLHARLQIRPGDAQAAGFALPGNDPSGGVAIDGWSDVLFVVGQKWRTHYVDRDGFLQGRRWNYLDADFEDAHGGQLASYDCGACHTTGYDPDATFEDEQGQPLGGIEGSWVEYNIGCEACHGPGAEHAAAPSRDNINDIVFDWYDPDDDQQPDPVDIRSSVVCGNCHYRNDRDMIQSDRLNQEQYNDWLYSEHSSSLQLTAVNTWCAKCHSTGNALFDSAEHFFTNFEPTRATHDACISCHDPHRSSHPRFEMLDFPGGSRDPLDFPAGIARYQGTDGNVATRDYRDFDNEDSSLMCADCHRQMTGFRRHADAGPERVIALEPPFASGQPFVFPHAEHVEEGYAECVDCHMFNSRESANAGDVRSHSMLPNEWETGSRNLPHFDETCGQCHAVARDCRWCHTDFGGDDSSGPETRTISPRGSDPRDRRAPVDRRVRRTEAEGP